jgi:hypothetical protein
MILFIFRKFVQSPFAGILLSKRVVTTGIPFK